MKALRKPLLYGLLVVVLLGALGYWVDSHLEPLHKREHVGYRGAARVNPLLAAERFLTRMGVAAESVRILDGLTHWPAAADTLVLSTPGFGMGQKQAARVRAWVQEGGHLILAPRSAYRARTESSSDRLLDWLAVRPHRNPSAGEDRHEGEPLLVALPEVDEPLDLRFDPGWRLEDAGQSASWEVADEHGVHLLQFRVGAGRVTVLSDLEVFHNGHIGHFDHARLLWHLARSDGRRGRVWLQYLQAAPPLVVLLWSHAWVLLVSAGVLLLAWLWGRACRFGPLLAPAPLDCRCRPRRRSAKNGQGP